MKARKGDAIIIVLGLLAIIMAASLAWIFLVRTGEKVARYTLNEVRARETAEIGIAEAVYRLQRDDFSHDHYGQDWHADFLGPDVAPGGDRKPGGRWFNVREDPGLSTRYAVLVKDEAGRVHLNVSGNIDDRGNHRVGSGVCPAELNLASLPGIGREKSASIVRSRSRPFGRPFLSVGDLKEIPGIGDSIFEQNHSFLTVHAYDRNIDSSLRPRIRLGHASLEDLAEGLRRCGFEDPGRIALLSANIKDFFDPDSLPTISADPEGNLFYGLEVTPYLNEVESSPDPQIKIKKKAITFWIARGHFIELFNPYPGPLPVGGWSIRAGLENIPIPRGAVVPARGYYTIGDSLALKVVYVPGSFPIITPLPIREPEGSDHYHPFLLEFSPLGGNLALYDRQGNVIEKTSYGPLMPGGNTWQKNDPRMRRRADWFRGRATPGEKNAVFMPEIGGEVCRLTWPGHFVIHDRPALTVGEIGFVHRGEQWRTLNLWRGPEKDLATQDVFCAVPVERNVPGRININTAAREVLETLPGFGPEEAGAVIAGRPYEHIGRVAPVLDRVSRGLGRWGYSGRDCAGDGYPGGDASREFLYRRISNLVTVRSNVFRIIAVGQVFRTPSENGKIEKEDILAEKIITAVYDRESGGGSFLRWKVE